MLPNKLRKRLYAKYPEDKLVKICEENYLAGKLDETCICEVCEDIRDILAKKKKITRERATKTKGKDMVDRIIEYAEEEKKKKSEPIEVASVEEPVKPKPKIKSKDALIATLDEVDETE